MLLRALFRYRIAGHRIRGGIATANDCPRVGRGAPVQEFLDVAIHTRAKRHSATAGVAYRVGADLIEGPTGEEHCYAHRADDVIEYDIAGGVFSCAQTWADAIEEAETRRNSQFYRDVRIALPCELPRKRQLDLARQWSDYLAERYETSVLYAVHRPARKSDQRNIHGHMLLPTRKLSAEGFIRERREDPGH